ncbi:MAG: aminoacyltransferase [Bifidobacteriaceae bacterium]|jgi:lipid II:glycine glycyltransferase (peptidoglycan interpeptide bridge formation enzyme)|nr:aminoacyltransferase [Bifidobacteriaceae bacterium]
MKFIELTDNDFQQFAENHPQANFNQTIAMKKVRQSLGFQICLLGIKQSDKIIAAGLVTIINSRVKSAGIYYGPLLDYSNLEVLQFWTGNLKNYLAKEGVVYCSINPNLIYAIHNSDGQIDESFKSTKAEFDNLVKLGYKHNGWTKTGVDAANRWHYVKNLAPFFDNYDNLIMSFRSTTRQRIRKYHKNNLQVRQLSLDEVDIFLNLLTMSASKHGFQPRDKAYFSALIKYFSEARLLNLLGAFTTNDTPVSTALFIIYAKSCIYFHSGNNSEYLKLLGSYALQDYMFKYCLDERIPKYNFLGFEAVFDKPNGVLDFKKGFKGYIEELVGSFELPINNFKYKLYRWLKK